MPLAKPATQAQEKAFTTSEGSVTESVQVAWLRVATFFNFFAFLPVDCLDFGSSGMVNRAHALASPSRRTTQACAQQGFLHAQPRSWGVISAPSGVAPAIGTNFEGVCGFQSCANCSCSFPSTAASYRYRYSGRISPNSAKALVVCKQPYSCSTRQAAAAAYWRCLKSGRCLKRGTGSMTRMTCITVL
jgi:hypothetical protein